MAKYADKYFLADAWKIIEEGFAPEYGEVAESVFSLANEYMGVRGYFEEGYSGAHMQGSYFNGIYEQKDQTEGGHGYKGAVNTTEFMVNSVDWLYTRICVDGERLDVAKSRIKNFRRSLDMHSGLLTRSLIWTTESGKELQITFERLISMKKNRIAVQKIVLRPLNFSDSISIETGLDFGTIHQAVQANLWECSKCSVGNPEEYLSILGTTCKTGQCVYSACAIYAENEQCREYQETDKKRVYRYEVEVAQDKTTELVKTIGNVVSKEGKTEAFLEECRQVSESLKNIRFEDVLEDNLSWWQEKWEKADIVIDGDEWNQQGIRFCIFQMYQTYHGAMEGTNIGAKGLTGEAYNGNAFWDTETYCLPFFLFHDKQAARNLLLFRYLTLDEAKKRANSLDCEGAFYPIATISGKECCNLWQHASLQLQASTAVAYGIWFYEKMTGDTEFLLKYGMEMLIEICRMLASRGDYTENGSKYGYYGVMGPDEFQMMVSNNCYTNYMGKFTLDYTLKLCLRLKDEYPAEYSTLIRKLNVTEEECGRWKDMEEKMILPYDRETKLYEQNDGYFKLPHIDPNRIPVEEFPLYSHWSYDRIYRNDMIKQPDVLMFLLLFNSCFDEETLRANYEYYEPRCIHESSLSPSVHSILASQLKKRDEAYRLFQFATRMDLDNYNRNSREGLHTTSIAAAWMNIVYGFGGLRSDGADLAFCPTIPKEWKEYSFRIEYQDSVLAIEVGKEKVKLSVRSGKEVDVLLYGKKTTVTAEGIEVMIPQEWKE